MKKIVPILLIIVLLALGAGYFIYRGTTHKARAAELVPQETIFFAQLPDLRATVQRFTQTELYKLGQEPEVQAFLERPRSKIPQSAEFQATIDRLIRVSPREAFLAVVSLNSPTPQTIAGFSYRGNRRAAEELLNPAREALKRTRPAGKADLITYGSTEIEVFTDNALTVARAFRGDWCFIATDLQLLETTLDRHERRATSEDATLANNDVYKRTLERLPAEREVMLFVQLEKLTERLLNALKAAGQPSLKEVQELTKVQAVGAATKFEGGQSRDTIFALAPGLADEHPLARNSLAMSSPATLVYYAVALPAQFELPEATTAMLPMVMPAFNILTKALAEKALTFADLSVAFGPEMGMLMEWPQQTMQPLFVVGLDVRDVAKAKGFVDVLTGGLLEIPVWTRSEHDGVTYYASPQQSLVPGMATPILALTNRLLVAGLNKTAIDETLARLQSGEAKLGGTAAYRAAQQSVAQPTKAYAYVDLRGLFERVYGTFRPLLAMSLAFMPDAGQYIDASKLPSTETISKHLAPIAYSQSTSADGVLVESTGTVTINQALLGIAAGSLTALWTGASSSLLDSAKLFGLPRTQAPSATPEPPLQNNPPPPAPPPGETGSVRPSPVPLPEPNRAQPRSGVPVPGSREKAAEKPAE